MTDQVNVVYYGVVGNDAAGVRGVFSSMQGDGVSCDEGEEEREAEEMHLEGEWGDIKTVEIGWFKG